MKNKKISPITIVALVGVLFVFAFLAWAFSQHGTIGLYRVNGIFRWAFLLLGLIGIVLLLSALLLQRLLTGDKKRRLLWLSIITCLVALPALIIPPAAFLYVNGVFSPGIGDTPPQIIMADGTGKYGIPDMAVVFNSEKAVKETLNWGLKDTKTKIQEDMPLKQHVFMLNNLQPDSMYQYQINSGPVFSFTTPATDGTLHFAIGSDAHYGASTARNDLTAEMLGEIANPGNDFDVFFYLGDLVEHGFQKSQWQQAFKAFSGVTSTIPTRFTAGNHETLFSGFGDYKKYCYPEGMSLQTGSRLWYRIDVGKVHFLILDVEWSAESYTQAQAAWLETQLKSIPANEWKIVMSHGYYYSSGSFINGWKWYDNPETIEQLTPLFNKYKVDMVFSGHNHHMELLKNSGTVYAICAAFGGLPDPASTYKSPSSIWEISGGYGFIDVSLKGNQCTLIFRDPDYKVLETYTLNKN
jgi:UDP-2,3-diacylglucosamine pyrophosphatase LpxH